MQIKIWIKKEGLCSDMYVLGLERSLPGDVDTYTYDKCRNENCQI